MGISSSISGTATFYAGGGGGYSGGAGGNGGGGAGSGISGTANTGAGASAHAGSHTGTGGSGIVILSYPTGSLGNTTGAPTSTFYSVVTATDQLDATSTATLDSVTVTETLNSQLIYYSVSFDGRTTFTKYATTTGDTGWRPIVRNNSGTWQYNSNASDGVSNVTWTNSTVNAMPAALSQAVAASAYNQMTGTNLSAVTASQFREQGGFINGITSTLDFSESFKTTSASQIPQVDNIAINYTKAGFKVVQTDTNTTRLYNYTGAAQSLRLDVSTASYTANVWSSLSSPVGNLSLGMNSYTTTLTYGNTTGGSNLFSLTDTTNNTGTGYLLDLTTASGSTLKPFHVNATGTEAMSIIANGNVGVGTTTPAQMFSVGGKIYTTGGVQFADGSLQTAAAAAASNGLQGQVGFYNTNGSTISGTSTITILQNGLVGISSTTPGYKLSVAGSGFFDGGTVTASSLIATSSITTPSLTLTTPAINSILSTNADGLLTATSTPTFGSFNATTTTATSTIAGFLDVLGTGTNATSTYSSNLWVKGTLQTGTGSMFLSDTGLTSSDGNLSIQRNATSYFNNGKVGIGTTTPGSRLVVVGSSAGAELEVLQLQNDSAASVANAVSQDFNLRSDSALRNAGQIKVSMPTITDASRQTMMEFVTSNSGSLATAMTIKGSNVGIGTTGPDGNLSIGALVPRLTFSPTTADNADEGGIWFREVSSHGLPGVAGSYGIYMGIDGTNNIFNINAWSNNVNKGGISLDRDTGNVGIGTTGPTRTLDVQGNTNGYPVRFGNPTSWDCGTSVNNGDFCNNAVGTGAGDGRLVWKAHNTQFYVLSDGSGDYAEFFYQGDEGAEPGDVVVLSNESTPISDAGKVKVSDPNDNNPKIVGVVSWAKSGHNDPDNNRWNDPKFVNVGMVGQVVTKVSEENGQIQVGDRLTTSKTLPGYAMKMTDSSQSIGIALESFDSNSNNDQNTGLGTVLIFVNVGYQTGSSDNFHIASNGSVGIGTSTPATPLHIYSNSLSGGVATFENANASCTIDPTNSSLTCSSDEKLKKDIVTIDTTTTLNKLLQLRPVTYHWNGEGETTQTHTGFIAQEVEQVFPEFVSTDSQGRKSVAYSNFIPAMVSAIQQLNTKVTTIDTRLTNLETLVASFTPQNTGGVLIVVSQWLASAGNGIVDVFAGTFRATDKLCINDTCVTETQLQALLANVDSVPTNSQTPNPDPGQATSTDSTNSPQTDTSSPTITVLGDNPAIVTTGTSYADLGATVTDTNTDGSVNNSLGLHFNLNGVDMNDISINTFATSTNTIVYSAVDSAGNFGYATRTVEVIEQ